jgi:hypothetical protein
MRMPTARRLRRNRSASTKPKAATNPVQATKDSMLVMFRHPSRSFLWWSGVAAGRGHANLVGRLSVFAARLAGQSRLLHRFPRPMAPLRQTG